MGTETIRTEEDASDEQIKKERSLSPKSSNDTSETIKTEDTFNENEKNKSDQQLSPIQSMNSVESSKMEEENGTVEKENSRPVWQKSNSFNTVENERSKPVWLKSSSFHANSTFQPKEEKFRINEKNYPDWLREEHYRDKPDWLRSPVPPSRKIENSTKDKENADEKVKPPWLQPSTSTNQTNNNTAKTEREKGKSEEVLPPISTNDNIDTVKTVQGSSQQEKEGETDQHKPVSSSIDVKGEEDIIDKPESCSTESVINPTAFPTENVTGKNEDEIKAEHSKQEDVTLKNISNSEEDKGSDEDKEKDTDVTKDTSGELDEAAFLSDNVQSLSFILTEKGKTGPCLDLVGESV